MKVNITNEDTINPKLSIVIPTYNEKPRIEKLVHFLLESCERSELEIIIVDAAKSTDNIDKIRFPKEVIVVKSEVSQRSSQLQMGADVSNGAVLFFLHADTVPPLDYFKQVMLTLKVVDFGMFKYQFDQNNWSLKFNGWMTQWRGFYTGGGDQGLFLKRTVFNSINGFDTSLDIMEDYDIFWRLKKAKYNYQIVKSPAIVSARKHLNNSTLKVNIVNLVTLIGFKVNGNAKSWSKFYARIIK